MSKVVNILWTSGWDSTFRLLQLVNMNAIIQPIYIIDTNRGSLKIEIERMNEIKKMIYNKYPESKNNILPTKFIGLSDIKKNNYSTNAYKNLRKETFFGSQMEWISWLSKMYNGLEHCVHKDDNVESILKDNVKYYDDKFSGGYWKVDENSSKDIVDLCGDLRYPLLHYTKLDMKREAEKMDNIEILKKSWFCFDPINGEPCGLCNPCKYAIEEGMSFRFSKSGLRRHKYKKIYGHIIRIKKRLLR